MAITTVNAFYQGIGPTVSAEVLAGACHAGPTAHDINGYALPILDGSVTTFIINWIDGTKTLRKVPKAVNVSRSDPPAWYTGYQYQIGDVVLGSGHVQQATSAGTSAASAPTWKTDGTSVSETSGPTWLDLGAIGLSTIQPVTVTAITNVSGVVTLSAAGTSTQIPLINFTLLF